MFVSPYQILKNKASSATAAFLVLLPDKTKYCFCLLSHEVGCFQIRTIPDNLIVVFYSSFFKRRKIKSDVLNFEFAKKCSKK